MGGVRIEYDTTVVSLSLSMSAAVQSVVVTDKAGAQRSIKCRAVVNTMPVRNFIAALQRGGSSNIEDASPRPTVPECVSVLEQASLHLYRGWIVEVEKPKSDLNLVLDW